MPAFPRRLHRTLARRRAPSQSVDPRLSRAVDALLRDLTAASPPAAPPERRGRHGGGPSPAAQPLDTSERPLRRRSSRLSARSVASLALLGLVALGTVVSVGAAARLHDAPAWWRSVRADAPETASLATRVERAVLQHVQTPRPLGQPWRVSVTIPQANAWLASRLPLWAANRSQPLPGAVQQVQANFEAGRVTLGALLKFEGERQIVAATFTPAVHSDGSLWLEDLGATAGRLDLPRDWTIARLRDWLPERLKRNHSADAVLSALASRAPLFPDASLRLDDGVRVRLLDIRVVQGDLVLTCVNERDGSADARSVAVSPSVD